MCVLCCQQPSGILSCTCICVYMIVAFTVTVSGSGGWSQLPPTSYGLSPIPLEFHGGVFDWDHAALAMPVAALFPISSTTPRSKQSQLQQEPMFELEGTTELQTRRLKRERMQENEFAKALRCWKTTRVRSRESIIQLATWHVASATRGHVYQRQKRDKTNITRHKR